MGCCFYHILKLKQQNKLVGSCFNHLKIGNPEIKSDLGEIWRVHQVAGLLSSDGNFSLKSQDFGLTKLVLQRIGF